MSATHALRARHEIELPDADRTGPRRIVTNAAGPGAPDVGPARPSEAGVGRPRRSFLPPERSRAPRPLQTGGQPPTVIRNLDALFAADHRRRSEPPPAPNDASGIRPIDPTPSTPMDRAAFAQALLSKVASDFAPPAPASTPAPVTSRRHDDEPPTAPGIVLPDARPLADDDEDLARLVPWHVRLWRKLFGG